MCAVWRGPAGGCSLRNAQSRGGFWEMRGRHAVHGDRSPRGGRRQGGQGGLCGAGGQRLAAVDEKGPPAACWRFGVWVCTPRTAASHRRTSGAPALSCTCHSVLFLFLNGPAGHGCLACGLFVIRVCVFILVVLPARPSYELLTSGGRAVRLLPGAGERSVPAAPGRSRRAAACALPCRADVRRASLSLVQGQDGWRPLRASLAAP